MGIEQTKQLNPNVKEFQYKGPIGALNTDAIY